jgi:hypothetical protein
MVGDIQDLNNGRISFCEMPADVPPFSDAEDNLLCQRYALVPSM